MLKRTQRHPILLFLVLVTALATVGYGVALSSGQENVTVGILIVQFSPMLAAFISALWCRRSLRGFGWTWRPWRYQFIAWALPFLIALVSFSLIWLTGTAQLDAGPFIAEAQEGLNEMFSVTLTSVSMTILAVIAVNATIGLLVGFGAIGEELGWRGFLTKELMRRYSFATTSIISGAIWAAYHYPLLIWIVAPQMGVSVWPLLLSSLLAGICLTFILNWLRIKSGSVWTAIIFHAALNIHVQGFFENMTFATTSIGKYISGEYGFMIAATCAVILLVSKLTKSI
ncbi:MAG: CPBP family intramembrane metalloprotease [Cognatishimia sp.]|uniref:CPBP family intramembrane glutamic endopeptidase n=1 Tax=Cognatishimia sp. TaxID=2211648 RepID=UPI003B8AA221